MITEVQQIEGSLNQNGKLEGNISANNSIVGASVNVGTYTENDYSKLKNKPQINDVTIVGSLSLEQLDIQKTMSSLTNLEIESIIGD